MYAFLVSHARFARPVTLVLDYVKWTLVISRRSV